MLIECKIKRKGGSRIVMLDGTTYHFAPADGANAAPHVAFVTEPAHIERLLSITEGYRIAPAAAQATITAQMPEPAGAKPQAPAAPAVDPDTKAPDQMEPDAHQGLNREALEALYIKATGKKPHPAAKDETLLTAIKAARES